MSNRTEFNLVYFDLEKNKLLEETKKFDFPFLANNHQKCKIIQEKKEYIDNFFFKFLQDSIDAPCWPDSIWICVQENVAKNFESLSEKRKLNGFYLQEVMHEYSKCVSEYIINHFSKKERENSEAL